MYNQYKVTVDGEEMPELMEADDGDAALGSENYCDGGASQDVEITVTGQQPVIGADDEETGETETVSLTRTVRLRMRADWEVIS